MAVELIGQEAFDLIVREEDSDANYYAAHYTHFEWPGGASGPTVGIGYDVGYCTTNECVSDWMDIISDDEIAVLLLGVGLRGEAARAFVSSHGASVTITWDQAIKEFGDREVPKWDARARNVLPNYDMLPIDCRGALVSLIYNRGAAGFNLLDSRYAEERNIKGLMAFRRFEAIPDEIRSMQRLWVGKAEGLVRRREHEARLFEQGLRKAG